MNATARLICGCWPSNNCPHDSLQELSFCGCSGPVLTRPSLTEGSLSSLRSSTPICRCLPACSLPTPCPAWWSTKENWIWSEHWLIPSVKNWLEGGGKSFKAWFSSTPPAGAHPECHLGRWCCCRNLCWYEHWTIWRDADRIGCRNHLYSGVQIPNCEFEIQSKSSKMPCVWLKKNFVLTLFVHSISKCPLFLLFFVSFSTSDNVLNSIFTFFLMWSPSWHPAWESRTPVESTICMACLASWVGWPVL